MMKAVFLVLLLLVSSCSFKQQASIPVLELSETTANLSDDSSAIYFYGFIKNTSTDKTITSITWKIEFYSQDKTKLAELFTVTKKSHLDGFLKILPGETKKIMIGKAGRYDFSDPITPRAAIISYESSVFTSEWDKPMLTDFVAFIVD